MQRMKKNLGFSLIELMVGIAVLGIVAVLAMPTFSAWIQNSKTRTVAESLQNGIRAAQAEAVSTGRQVVFFVTDVQPSLGAAATLVGTNWGIRSVTIGDPNTPERYIQGAVLAGQGGAVVVTTSSAEIRFNSIGRLTNSPSRVIYNVTNAKGSRRLDVIVSSSGSVRMCDPDKSIATAADGC